MTENSEDQLTQNLYVSKFPPGWGEVEFWANPDNILAGEKTTLHWSGPDGATYNIHYINEGKIVNLPPKDKAGEFALTLTENTTFTLDATEEIKGNLCWTSRQTTVTIIAVPEILSFTGKGGLGSDLQLTWETKNADHVEASWTANMLVANPMEPFVISPPFKPVYKIWAVREDGKRSEPESVRLGWKVAQSVIRLDGPGISPLHDEAPADAGELVGFTVAPNGSAFLVIYYKVDTAWVIDTTKGKAIQAPISVGKGPCGLRSNKDRIFVTNLLDNTVSVIDIGSWHTIQPPIPVGRHPWGIDISPDGKYVFVVEDGSISMIDTQTLKVTQTMTISVGDPLQVGTPFLLAVSRDGYYIFVGYMSSNKILVIDVKAWNVKKVIEREGNDFTSAITVPLDGDCVFVANFPGNTVSVIDIPSLEVKQIITVGTALAYSELAVSPDRAHIFVGSRNNTISVLIPTNLVIS